MAQYSETCYDKAYELKKLLDVLRAEDGYVEKKKNCPNEALYEKVGAYAGADNWTKYWKDCKDAGLANYQGSYYCIATLFWAMMKAYGLEAAQKLCLQTFMINCQKTYEAFNKAKRVHTTPMIGDIVVFHNGSRYNHAELVVDVQGDTFKTFGANTSATTSVTVYNGGGCRWGKTYSIAGQKNKKTKFCRPNYGIAIKDHWERYAFGDKYGDYKFKYRLGDGTYVKNAWKYIDNNWYAFDEEGWARTGWFESNGEWYYLCYKYFKMEKGWKKIDGQWHFLNENTGAMYTGWLQREKDWYYMNPDGTMATGWMQIQHVWYWFRPDGRMMNADWKEIDGKWYYFATSGAMYSKKWKQGKDGYWYYLQEDGSMAVNTIIQDELDPNLRYKVNEQGRWVN